MTAGKQSDASRRSRQRRERRQAFAESFPKVQQRALGRSTTRETPLQIHLRGIELGAATHEYLRRHIGNKLGKFGWHVNGITVRIENVSGPKGMPAYHCRFAVMLPDRRSIVVTEEAATPAASFKAAANTAERTVRRRLDRVRKTRHERRSRAAQSRAIVESVR